MCFATAAAAVCCCGAGIKSTLINVCVCAFVQVRAKCCFRFDSHMRRHSDTQHLHTHVARVEILINIESGLLTKSPIPAHMLSFYITSIRDHRAESVDDLKLLKPLRIPSIYASHHKSCYSVVITHPVHTHRHTHIKTCTMEMVHTMPNEKTMRIDHSKTFHYRCLSELDIFILF